jgi:bacterioferritin-associated ferredoxin
MYVCTCNGISERNVDAAIKDGAKSPSGVHHACGAKPQCGRCLPEIADRLRALRVSCSSKSDAFANSCALLTLTIEQDEVPATA